MLSKNIFFNKFNKPFESNYYQFYILLMANNNLLFSRLLNLSKFSIRKKTFALDIFHLEKR